MAESQSAHRLVAVGAGASVLLAPLPVLAAGQTAASETVLIAQLVVLLVCGRLLGEAAQRLGQPAVMGQLLAGVLLGPSFLGAAWPAAEATLFPSIPEQKAMLAGIAELGILLLLLLTGMETDIKLVRKVGKASLVIAATGLSVPFACGFALGQVLPESVLPRPELRLVTSLFLGTALSISSVKIVAMVIREMDFMRRNVGQVVIAAAIIEDTIGWIIIAVILGIVTHGALDPSALGQTILGTAIFLAASFTLGRRLVARLIRWANDGLVIELPVITTILVVMGVMALITHAIGIHTVLGAFVAGMLIGQSPILTRHIDEQLRGLITALFMPIFFAVAGLATDLTALADPTLLAMTIGFVAIASIGKFAGAFLGGRLGGMGWHESLAIGCGMNARGSTEIIVASVGLSMGALSQDLYTIIVAMAVLTTLAMPPMLRWALLRIPISETERTRLELEQREETGFVTQFERLLLAVDDSANARLAAGIVGRIAGSRQILTTVLELSSDAASTPRPASAAPVETVIRASAEAAKESTDGEESTGEPEVTARRVETVGRLRSSVVEGEARKGYDLLVIGVAPATSPGGLISEQIADIARAWDGPLAIIEARNAPAERPTIDRFRILLAIRATTHSRHGAEMAIELARASNSSIEALYVSDANDRSWSRATSLAVGLEEEAALKEVVTQAELYDVTIRTSIYVSKRPGAAIVDAARRGRHDLIVLGASRRPGEQLFFGEVVAEVLDDAPCSVMIVSS